MLDQIEGSYGVGLPWLSYTLHTACVVEAVYSIWVSSMVITCVHHIMDSDIYVTLLFFLLSPISAFANLSSSSPQLSGLMISFQFYYMAKGLDTMVQDNPREEVTVSDGLQLGRSIADQTDARNGENESNDQTGEVCPSVTTVP